MELTASFKSQNNPPPLTLSSCRNFSTPSPPNFAANGVSANSAIDAMRTSSSPPPPVELSEARAAWSAA
jgi:hypothetical protein